MNCPHCDNPINVNDSICPTCNKDVQPVPRRSATLDPAAALANVEASTAAVQAAARRTKQCPFCAETILAEAVVCKHCKSDLKAGRSATPSLPFPPVPGAKPTSGLVYFLLIVLVGLLVLMVAPVVFWFGVVLSMIWVGFDASTHKLASYDSQLSSPTIACLGTIALWIVVFPMYLGIRSRIRAGVQPVKA
jgi:hypothetical protein